MQLEDVGDVIATRVLHMKTAKGPPKTIIVRIGRPQPFPEPPHDYFVPYQIVGIGPEKVHYAAGVDAVQAVQLVMQVIGDHLAALSRDSEGAVYWEVGQDEHDLGFPIYSPQ